MIESEWKGRIEHKSSCVFRQVEFVGAQPQQKSFPAGELLLVRAEVEVTEPILFDFTLTVSVLRAGDGVLIHRAHLHQDGWDISWLPRGIYIIEWRFPPSLCIAGEYSVQLEAAQAPGGLYIPLCSVQRTLKIEGHTLGEERISPPQWRIEKKGDREGISGLSWSKGKENWFYKHFDHAARVVIHYMFDDSPLLRGKILDVGCGEGITDLGICLRKKPRLLVGLDIERHFLQLPRIMQENNLPFSRVPENLIFCRGDANRLPFADDCFDVVVSWASLEHIVGEPRRVLQEIKRVLKDGGLFFLHPGLYYSSAGHHLGEFTPEPFVHLKKTTEELRNIVFTAEPRYMDRGGITYTPSDFWRYYTELNKITVSDLEKDLRQLGFEFHKVAVRAEDLVTYTPELQKYSIQDLATGEIYLALWNRKRVTSWAGKNDETGGEEGRRKNTEGGEGKQGFELWNTQPSESVCGIGEPNRQWSQVLEQRCVEYFLGCRNVLDLGAQSRTFSKLLAEKGIRSVSLGWQNRNDEQLGPQEEDPAGGD
ncbi:MAG: methyltransferase domain-containing protein, partial [Thermodesulfobacteriota bacterium]